MVDKNQIENSLKKLPESVEPNKSLVNDAEKLTEELYSAKKSPKKKHWRFATVMSLCCACILIGIITPIVYYSKPAEPPIIKNYTDGELGKEDLTDIQAFVSGNGYDIKYFSDAQQSSIYKVLETSQPAIIEQQFIFFDEDNFDMVRLEICLTNDTFNRYEIYQQLQEQKQINGIEVQYMITETRNEFVILAKCRFKSNWYYWNISSLQAEGRIDYYIDLLFE